eukprot:9358526-Ditylum_brightwellii.AAC.1
MVFEPSKLPGLPSARHPNSLPVEMSHELLMLPQRRSWMDFDGVAEKISGNGKQGIILGGAIRWRKKLFSILGCGILAG